MTIQTGHALCKALRDFGHQYASMRFGQLVVCASALAGEKVPGDIEEVTDEAVLSRINSSLQANRGMVYGDAGSEGMSPVREELIGAIEALADRHPGWRLCQLVNRVSERALKNIYDVEDEQLLEAVRGLLQHGTELSQAQ